MLNKLRNALRRWLVPELNPDADAAVEAKRQAAVDSAAMWELHELIMTPLANSKNIPPA